MEDLVTALFPGEEQKFLVVDDEESIVELLKDYLSLKGYSCVGVYNGREALERLRQDPSFTIVITDICMPEMDGIEFIKQAKAEWPDIDFIAITAYTRRYRYSDVIKAGASDFINKPFDLDELQAKIDRIIRERNLRHKLRAVSRYDALTGIYNRRYFEERVPEECHRATRQGYPLHLVMMDVDRFKEYNDTFGHQAGDELLQKLAETLIRCTRHLVDLPFRYGGDEFALLIPSCDNRQVEKIVKRILAHYEALSLKPTSLSAGVARFLPRGLSLKEAVDDLIRRADAALYRAKQEGRGRVCFDPESLTDQV